MSVYCSIINAVFIGLNLQSTLASRQRKCLQTLLIIYTYFMLQFRNSRGVHHLLPLSNHNVIIQVLCYVSCEVHMKIVLTLLLPVKSPIARCFSECSEFLCL